MRDFPSTFGPAVVTALAMALAAPTPAIAQPTDSPAAQVLFDQARDLAARGDYPQACAKFEANPARHTHTGGV